MTLRPSRGAAALAAAMTVAACGPSGRAPEGQLPGGCAGVCGPGSSTGDGGTIVVDGGMGPPAGPTPPQCGGYRDPPHVNVRTLLELRATGPCPGKLVRLSGVVVTGFDGDSTDPTDLNFWVEDPNAPGFGYFIDTQPADPAVVGAAARRIEVGDVIEVEGFLGHLSDRLSHLGYRPCVRGSPGSAPLDPGGALRITRTGSTPLPPVQQVSLDGGFGNAEGGAAQPNPGYAGTRVHIAGPLEVVDPRPVALTPLNAPDAGVLFGYEVTGGILVVDRREDPGASRLRLADGGADSSCEWGAVAQDAGVRFPDGISGVWDTYTHAPCADGGFGFGCVTTGPGFIPGTGGPGADGGNPYTYVLYPLGCADVAGEPAGGSSAAPGGAARHVRDGA